MEDFIADQKEKDRIADQLELEKCGHLRPETIIGITPEKIGLFWEIFNQKTEQFGKVTKMSDRMGYAYAQIQGGYEHMMPNDMN